MPATPDHATILAFDFGRRRIGVAVGQTVTRSASPVGVVANSDSGPDWQRIGSLITEWGAARLIVGMPLNVDGSPSAIAAEVDAFIEGLRRFALPIESTDERYSSSEAEEMLALNRKRGARGRISRGRISKGHLDAAAATLIAERWLKDEH